MCDWLENALTGKGLRYQLHSLDTGLCGWAMEMEPKALTVFSTIPPWTMRMDKCHFTMKGCDLMLFRGEMLGEASHESEYNQSVIWKTGGEHKSEWFFTEKHSEVKGLNFTVSDGAKCVIVNQQPVLQPQFIWRSLKWESNGHNPVSGYSPRQASPSVLSPICTSLNIVTILKLKHCVQQVNGDLTILKSWNIDFSSI